MVAQTSYHPIIETTKKASESTYFTNNFLELFDDQVRSHPQQIVATYDNNSLTYEELDRQSDQLANHLINVGVEKESLVGIYSSLSIDFIVCLLGIMKAGGVYLPLDPSYSIQRIKQILQDGNPVVIMTEGEPPENFKSYRTIKINKTLIASSKLKKKKNIRLELEQLAYVIYTSGSTGNPKGIMVSHKSLQNIALAHNNYYPSNIKMLVAGGVCFDATLLVIFHSLVNGEHLYLFNGGNERVKDLIEFIEKNQINFMICIPSQYLRILRENRSLLNLKCVSLTGENLPRGLCTLHAKLAPNSLLYNEYGPSECAIGATIAKIFDPQDRIIRKISVGKPIPNTEIYILDKNLNIVPKGTKGEICIAGIGLARGYLNNPALSQRKFVSKSFSGTTATRLYRTGDFGYFAPNGDLVFLGRKEQGAYIGSEWIDLGEIEYQISQFPKMQESAILIQPDPSGKTQLVAYIRTSSKNRSAINRALLHFCQKKLPPFMIPSFVIHIDSFPLTSNGKIDRDALMARHGRGQILDASFSSSLSR